MQTTLSANDIIARCSDLKSFWLPRHDKFKEWYQLIQMVDALKTEKMESFVGNDPQSSFKLLRHMLDQKIPHRIPHEQVTVEMAKQSSAINILFDTIWNNVFDRYEQRGRQGWTWDLIGYLLATGWYSVFAMIHPNGEEVLVELWNPDTVYQEWDDLLVGCAHIDTISTKSALRLATRNGWKWTPSGSTATILRDYWRLDDNGVPCNSVLLGKELVKPETPEPTLDRIPIFTGPVGGLPDNGPISGSDIGWRGEVGQSSVATNANIYKYWNKWWTFGMQLLRDTAQPRIIEKSRTGKNIVKPEDVFKRGAIFRMTPDEDVGFLVPPSIPVEIRSAQLDMEAMMQRGGPSWSMYGSAVQGMTAYVMSQIAASTGQIVSPFHRGVVKCFTAIDNFFLNQMRKFNYKPYGQELPKDLDPNIRITAEYEIRIPGDLIQRATVARMLDPDFRISTNRVMEELFPEVKNPLRERALVRSDRVERHPMNTTIETIQSFRAQAERLREAGADQDAELFERAANKIQETELGLPPEQAQQQPAPSSMSAAPAQPGRPPIGNRTEALPPRGTTEAPAPII